MTSVSSFSCCFNYNSALTLAVENCWKCISCIANDAKKKKPLADVWCHRCSVPQRLTKVHLQRGCEDNRKQSLTVVSFQGYTGHEHSPGLCFISALLMCSQSVPWSHSYSMYSWDMSGSFTRDHSFYKSSLFNGQEVNKTVQPTHLRMSSVSQRCLGHCCLLSLLLSPILSSITTTLLPLQRHREPFDFQYQLLQAS